MNKANVVFAGTPEFALVSLRALVEAGVIPAVVLTQPDRPSGRGKKTSGSPVKQFAQDSGIPVWQPQTLKDPDIVAALRDFEPDLMVVAAYGLLLPQDVLDIPGRGCLNVHASLLPRWRGAAPIQAAILAGDKQTGISLMHMEAGLDSGPVYARESFDIEADMTAGDAHDRLAELGGAMLVASLPKILDGSLKAEQQDNLLATYAPKIKTSDASIDWGQPATDMHRHVRAYNPVPGARFEFRDEAIKCWDAEPSDREGSPAGTVLSADKEGVVVACGEGSLVLKELQRPGRRRVSAAEFSTQFDLSDTCF